MTTLQFIAALTAALIGVSIMRMLHHFPFTLTHFAVMGGYWSAAALAYLVPRSVSRVLRTRLLACVLILSLLAFGLFLFVAQLQVAVPLATVFVPLFSLFVFSAASFLTGTRRSWSVASAVLLATLIVHFISLWWSYGFRTGSVLRLAAIQLIPLLAATATLVSTDNLIKTGDNPIGSPWTVRPKGRPSRAASAYKDH